MGTKAHFCPSSQPRGGAIGGQFAPLFLVYFSIAPPKGLYTLPKDLVTVMRLEDMTGLKHESKVKHAVQFFAVMFTFILVASMTASVASAAPAVWESKAAWPGAIGSVVACYADVSGAKYIYALESKGTPKLYRYSIAGDSWTDMATAGLPTTTQGSGMVWTGGDNIYILAGGTTNPNLFYRYSISGNSTAAMTPLPSKANSGSGLAYDGGDKIYALSSWSSGASYSFLFAYSISGNSWENLGNAPALMGSGSSICRVGDYLYLGRGGQTAYYRYTIAGGTWTTMASLPSSYIWGAGGGQEKVGTGYIFATRGGGSATTYNFMRYRISDDNWTYLADTPVLNSANDRLTFDGSYLYMIGGYTTVPATFFMRYEVDITPPDAPELVSPANGAAITDNTPTFVWNSVADPSGVTYQIQIDDNSDFSSPVYSAIDLTENTYTVPGELPMFTQFFWHVRAVDGVGNVGDGSGTWDFTVVPMGAIGVLLMPLLMLLPFAFMLRRQNRRYHY